MCFNAFYWYINLSLSTIFMFLYNSILTSTTWTVSFTGMQNNDNKWYRDIFALLNYSQMCKGRECVQKQVTKYYILKEASFYIWRIWGPLKQWSLKIMQLSDKLGPSSWPTLTLSWNRMDGHRKWHTSLRVSEGNRNQYIRQLESFSTAEHFLVFWTPFTF